MNNEIILFPYVLGDCERHRTDIDLTPASEVFCTGIIPLPGRIDAL